VFIAVVWDAALVFGATPGLYIDANSYYGDRYVIMGCLEC
jgi:hypothetical protein